MTEETDRAERQRIRDRIKKEINEAASIRQFVVEIMVDPDDPDAWKLAQCRLRCVSGVLKVSPI